MKQPLQAAGAAIVALVVPACVDSAQDYVAIDLLGAGTPASEVSLTDATIALDEARVAFGPLYLCATESAEPDLCSTDVAEFLGTKVVDALASRETSRGTLRATTETVRSGFFDYGISWLLTETYTRVDEGAADGHSALLRGHAERSDGSTLSFEARIDVKPLSTGARAVTGLRTRQTITEDTQRLVVRFDPSRWLERIDADALFALDDDGDGHVDISEGDQAYDAIVLGMTADAPPALNWD